MTNTNAADSVGVQHLHVVHALPARRQQRHQPLDERDLGVPAHPLLEVQMVADPLRQPQRPERFDHQGKPGVGRSPRRRNR